MQSDNYANLFTAVAWPYNIPLLIETVQGFMHE